jgi:hypothetical protein
VAGETSALGRALHATGSSWINLVERFFALLTEKQIRRGIHRSTLQLEKAIRHYLGIYNETAKPFVWTKPPIKSWPV